MRGDGQLRAEDLLLSKRQANAKVYADLPTAPHSRQVQRRAARKSAKRQLGREEFNRVVRLKQAAR